MASRPSARWGASPGTTALRPIPAILRHRASRSERAFGLMAMAKSVLIAVVHEGLAASRAPATAISGRCLLSALWR